MFPKLAVTIIALGLAACALLAMRQARLQTAHELAEAQLRIGQHDDRLLVLYAEIAGLISPDRIDARVREGQLQLAPALDSGLNILPDDGPFDIDSTWSQTPPPEPQP